MEVLRLKSIDSKLKVWDPVTEYAGSLTLLFKTYCRIRKVNELALEYDKSTFHDMVMALFKYDEDEKQGLVKDLLSYLQVMGIPYKPILLIPE